MHTGIKRDFRKQMGIEWSKLTDDKMREHMSDPVHKRIIECITIISLLLQLVIQFR